MTPVSHRQAWALGAARHLLRPLGKLASLALTTASAKAESAGEHIAKASARGAVRLQPPPMDVELRF